jgi:hypothetical protein
VLSQLGPGDCKALAKRLAKTNHTLANHFRRTSLRKKPKPQQAMEEEQDVARNTTIVQEGTSSSTF